MEHGRSGRAFESLEGAQPNPHWMTGAISWLLSVDNDMGCMPKAYGPVRYHVNREMATNAISDRDRPVVTTTMYGLIAAIQSTLGPDDERVVTTVTRILRTECATSQHLATYRLSA